MMEVIAVESAPIQIFVVNVHVMMGGYHVSQGNIFQKPSGRLIVATNSIFDILRKGMSINDVRY